MVAEGAPGWPGTFRESWGMNEVPMVPNAPTTAMSAARAFFAAYSAHDVDGMLQLCSNIARIRYVPMGPLGTGSVHTTGRKIWNGLITALPDMTVTVKSAFADDRHVGAEVVIADAKRGYELPHAFFLTVDESYRISEVTAYWDNMNFGFQFTKAGVVRLVDAITSMRKR
jgi:ketosteroid isomerase-like protein